MPRRSSSRMFVGTVAVGAALACADDTSSHVEPLPALAAVETLRIGSVDDPETALTTIRALEIGPDGRIYALERREIRVFSPDGSPLFRFGGQGDGPGEFQSTLRMDLVQGELRVWDPGLNRVTRFDLEGGLLGVESFHPKPLNHPFMRGPLPFWALPDNTFIGEYGLNQRGDDWYRVEDSPVVRVALDGEMVDTVAIRPLAGRYMILHLNEPTSAPVPFGYDPLLEVSPTRMEAVLADRRVRSDAPSMRVTRLAVDGDTLWSREYTYDPVPIDPVYVDSFVVGLSEQLESVGFATLRQAESEIRETMVIPEHAPPVDRVRIGRDGSVWLMLADRDPVDTRWLVLDETGEIHGRVSLPHGFVIRHATLDVVWGMAHDGLDVPYIVSFDIRPAPE
jgi:hypothetical protein